jgi:hypothetical protein
VLLYTNPSFKGAIMKYVKDVFVSLTITAFVCELALRIFAAFFPQPYFYSEHSYRFQAQPNQRIYGYTTNSRGFYDSEHSKERKSGEFRILSLGDSFTFGVVPREDNFNSILEKKLIRDGYEVEVINMGIPATAPRQYLHLLQSEGKLFQPNLVLVNFFTGNDFEAIDPVRDWKTYSYVVSFINYVYILSTKLNVNNLNIVQQYDDTKPAFAEDYYINLETKRSWPFKKNNMLFELMFNKTIEELEKINTICKSIGAKLVVSIIPDELQVNPELIRKVSLAAHFDAADYDFDQPNKMLAASLSALSISYVDLLEIVREKSLAISLYKPNDSHWNIAGNKLAGEILADFLENNRFIIGKTIEGKASRR